MESLRKRQPRRSPFYQARQFHSTEINEEIICLVFEGFTIRRKVVVNVRGGEGGSTEINNNNMSNTMTNYRQRNLQTRRLWTTKQDYVPGVRAFVKPRFVANRIPSYEVPERLKYCVLDDAVQSEIVEELRTNFPTLFDALTFKNYIVKMGQLLHLEEIQCYIHMRMYDCERAHFSKEAEYLSLEIENLYEKRPSLVIGDSIRATNPWAESTEDSQTFEGIIHKVYCNRILLKFHNSFHNRYNGEDYKLHFLFSRFGFRKQHYSTQLAVRRLGEDFLFPSKLFPNEKIQLNVELEKKSHMLKITTDGGSTTVLKDWFNKSLNIIQKIAIRNILKGECRPMPYVVFGPPGTGKTMTIVETILQIFTLIPNSRILVGTPSNSAADLITERLINSEVLNPGDFVRLVSQNTVERDLLPDFIKPYCATVDIASRGTSENKMLVTESGLKLRCQQKHIGRHRITISTCSTLGNLHQMEFKPGHFTHVLVDEAGQCIEAETMIPVSMVNKTYGQVVLAGDPLQLGPIVLSKFAADNSLDISFLVRILERSPYKKDTTRFVHTEGFDPRLITKLIFNYRSIPSVLKTYNDLFYDSELQSFVVEDDHKDMEANEDIQKLHRFRRAMNLSAPPPYHGAFFFAIRGENKQDHDSPSWYNCAEVSQVYLSVIMLYKAGISADSIGIITPYKKQVMKIRNMFIGSDMKFPKIGSVEEFQGQERDIILISTVRSTKSLIMTDLKQSLGFVKSAKRMNVAISRARSSLVVFGNPYLLSLDDSWRKYIRYCQANEACLGCDFKLDL